MTDIVSDALAYEHGAAKTRILKTSEWTEPVNERYLVLFHEDHTHAEIAAKLNAEFGTSFTRNACIGKKNRLGITRECDAGSISIRRQPAPPRDRTVRVHRGQSSPVVKRPALVCVALAPLDLTLAELDQATQCHFIPGDDLLYCGHPQMDGSSYCTPHFYLCRTPPKPRSEYRVYRDGAAA